MKQKQIFFILSLTLFLLGIVPQLSAQKENDLIEVKVIVDGISNDKGEIRIGFYNKPEGAFEVKNSVYGVHLKAKKGKVEHIFYIKPGNYAIGVIHDENNNGVLDFNILGIPKEDYGFSGSATRKEYEKALIRIDKSETIIIKL